MNTRFDNFIVSATSAENDFDKDFQKDDLTSTIHLMLFEKEFAEEYAAPTVQNVSHRLIEFILL